jgi:hypothetical protein
MITKIQFQEIDKLFKEEAQVIFICKAEICDKIDGIFYDKETDNLTITLSSTLTENHSPICRKKTG